MDMNIERAISQHYWPLFCEAFGRIRIININIERSVVELTMFDDDKICFRGNLILYYILLMLYIRVMDISL